MEKTVDLVEVVQLSRWKVILGAQKGGAFSAFRICDGAFSSEGLVNLNQKWAE